MSLTNRTDSDRLDDLIEAAEKQTAAINRLAMAVQEGSDKPSARGGFIWWIAGLAAFMLFVWALLDFLAAIMPVGNASQSRSVAVTVSSAYMAVSLYLIARCDSAIRLGQ
jgi:hypothetical protein